MPPHRLIQQRLVVVQCQICLGFGAFPLFLRWAMGPLQPQRVPAARPHRQGDGLHSVCDARVGHAQSSAAKRRQPRVVPNVCVTPRNTSFVPPSYSRLVAGVVDGEGVGASDVEPTSSTKRSVRVTKRNTPRTVNRRRSHPIARSQTVQTAIRDGKLPGFQDWKGTFFRFFQ